MLKGKNIILGITGSIAAYKSAELTSQLVKLGANVTAIMTKAATHFISPLTLSTLSKNKVITDLFETPLNSEVEHINLADKADILLIAPATANIIGKIAAGIADDFLTTFALACKSPILIAPAMNERMYLNPILQENIKKLKKQGVYFVEPEVGNLACGEQGIGRLADVHKIVAAIESILKPTSPLKGKKILITAGGTQEPIDPIRYIGNRSSGKMGYALAGVAKEFGAEVTLISAPTQLEPPAGVQTIFVETASQMRDEVLKAFPTVDIVISAAAVADFSPKEIKTQKIKKTTLPLVIELEKTIDILAELGQKKQVPGLKPVPDLKSVPGLKPDKILVGFAAESENLISNAKAKLKEKNLDLIVANDIKTAFGKDTTQVTIITKDGECEELPLLSKTETAREIMKKISKFLDR
ncbi:MAG: bifunctional phosphopantothenoylcysteine decarboxylase/phosphopantothenate--cysteine ligase CoaBC [bacterium]|nr:bifunctional phosphopantothenoylcysteine decarboxylase/phosphopantothenate--cysteine ligase CoaBC [bacterium]